MILRRLFLMLVVAASVAACGPVYDTQYHFIPPADPTGRQLAGQCRVVQNMCKQNCQMREHACRADARSEGMMEYQAYVAERRRKNLPLKRSPESFVSTYMCDSDRCEDACEDDYRGCYVEAGGQIRAQRVCVSFCDQQQPAANAKPKPQPAAQQQQAKPSAAQNAQSQQAKPKAKPKPNPEDRDDVED